LKQTGKMMVALGIVACGLVAGSFLFGGPRSAVAWRSVRAIAIESDDWGLAGFVPRGDSWRDLDRRALDPGNFPEVYWLSTLEDSSMVGRLNRVLASHTGRDGHPAVLQPNYVMSSLSHEGDRWVRHDLPDLPPGYHRPGLWKVVAEGIEGGTWSPEFHATWHYDPDRRKEGALDGELALTVTGRNIMLFPGSERARELGDWRNLGVLQNELDSSLAGFEALFGRKVQSVIAPDYHWKIRPSQEIHRTPLGPLAPPGTHLPGAKLPFGTCSSPGSRGRGASLRSRNPPGLGFRPAGYRGKPSD